MIRLAEYAEIEAVLDSLLGERIGFAAMVEDLVNGGGVWKGNWPKMIVEMIVTQLHSQGELLGYMVLLIVSGAFLSVIAKAFRGRQISDMGFYMIYLLLFLMMMRIFGVCYALTEQVVGNLISFMKVLMPAYLVAVAASAYRTSALVYYELFFLMIFYMQKFVMFFLLPCIRCYVLLTFLSYLVEEDFLEKGRKLLKKSIYFLLKAMIGIFGGLQMIQGMLTPAIDELKHTVISRGVAGLGSIGKLAQGATDVLLGSGVLIKNGIGAAGAICIIIICMVPVVRVSGYMLFCQLLSAVAEPISDRRLTDMVSNAGEGMGMLVKLLFTVGAMFLLTIAIVCVTTGGI